MILLTDKTTKVEYLTSSITDAMTQAAYLMSLGHEVTMEKGGN